MDDIVRQATEVGAARIVPLQSERTQVHLDGDRADKKAEKWRTGAIEAAKQCGNPWLPEIAGVTDFTTFLGTAKDEDLRLLASLHAGAASLKEFWTIIARNTDAAREDRLAGRARRRFFPQRDDRGRDGGLRPRVTRPPACCVAIPPRFMR